MLLQNFPATQPGWQAAPTRVELGWFLRSLYKWLQLFHNHPAKDKSQLQEYMPAYSSGCLRKSVQPESTPYQIHAWRNRLKPARSLPKNNPAVVPARFRETVLHVDKH